jgi:nitrogen fixation protein NifX
MAMALERRLKLVDTGSESRGAEVAVKVAFATSDMKRVDQHFGTAESFAVYSLSPGRASLMEVVQFGTLRAGESGGGPEASLSGGGPLGPSSDFSGHDEGKLAAKIDALSGCVAVYCQAVGASAINQLRIRGIEAVRVAAGTEIGDLLGSLREELQVGPEGWLAHAMVRQRPRSARRFDDMEQEGWIE